MFTLKTKSGKKKKYLYATSSKVVVNTHVFMCLFSATFKLPESVKWLKLNYRNTGFYIVHYGDDGWDALKDALSHNVSVLTQEDRASLIHNIFALSRYSGQCK